VSLGAVDDFGGVGGTLGDEVGDATAAPLVNADFDDRSITTSEPSVVTIPEMKSPFPRRTKSSAPCSGACTPRCSTMDRVTLRSTLHEPSHVCCHPNPASPARASPGNRCPSASSRAMVALGPRPGNRAMLDVPLRIDASVRMARQELRSRLVGPCAAALAAASGLVLGFGLVSTSRAAGAAGAVVGRLESSSRATGHVKSVSPSIAKQPIRCRSPVRSMSQNFGSSRSAAAPTGR